MSFDSITNRQEYFSEHYLASVIQADLNDLRKAWKVAEDGGLETPRSGLKSLGSRLFEAKQGVLEKVPGAQEAATEAVLQALGFTPERTVITTQRGEGTEVEIPVAYVNQDGSGVPKLIAIEAAFTGDVDSALGRGDYDPDVAGETATGLTNPVTVDGEKFEDPSRAISAVFEAEDPPRHILLIAGAIVVLASRGKWNEGRYLAVNLDIALERADVKAKGELETIAALFGADTLLPTGDDAEALIEDLDIKSLRNAAGVSEDLREGVRLAVEEIANEVITRRLEKNLAVYSDTDFADRVTRESLRFLYRILFLLYAESRPELDVVPALAEGYAAGYGLDRLRELALTDLETEVGRNGTHLHESLNLLFRLVNEGHRHSGHTHQGELPTDGVDQTGFIFNPLESDLFDPKATPLIDSVRLRNEVLRQVLARLLLTAEKGGKDRRFVSYSALGINQLGAVYERLMAYTGFLADEDLYEIRELDKGGKSKPDGGTWVVPIERADEFPEAAFVSEEDPVTGESKRLLHPKGSFVFRLSGRQRQRSASYYTPEILTEFVVRHALEELLDQDGQNTPADEILDLTVCEPALGSGAFLNEAINQLSARYLTRKQEELGEVIEPERYPTELQKVKAHFALHQAYGVDLNATAVELAEVSLWLNAMHSGLKAPWFGLHLRRGNSLVGARRAVYAPEKLTKRAWLKSVPTDRRLADGGIWAGEIHHFLLPAEGWGSVGQTKEAKELEPDEAEALREWAKRIKAGPSKDEAGRLASLARRVEALWTLAIERLEQGERDLRRDLKLYGQPEAKDDTKIHGDFATRKAVEDALDDEQSALTRVRLAMDAWCSLWFWPLDAEPPEWHQWIEMLEGLLGVDPDVDSSSLPQTLSFEDMPALLRRERLEEERFGMSKLDEVRANFEWLTTVEQIRDREGFFHWELEFGHVMKRDGFDLQVGNPPWVRPRWLDDSTLAEFDPWFGMKGGSNPKFKTHRQLVLGDDDARGGYLAERTSSNGLTEFLSSGPLFPDLIGLQTNLYMVFMPQTWAHMSERGTIGMLHPEGHFGEPKGTALRIQAYQRLRQHWHFVNEAGVFPEVHNMTDFGVHIYGRPTDVKFLMASNIQLPRTVDDSLNHDGLGEIPGIKTVDGRWDRRPHKRRIIKVDLGVLGAWAALFDAPGTPPGEARLMRPHTIDDLIALSQIGKAEDRLEDTDYLWTRSWEEDKAKRSGLITWSTEIPSDLSEVILQGPHFSVGNPFAKQPNPDCRSNKDWASIDLEELPDRLIPRTNLQRNCSMERYLAEASHWNGSLCSSQFRIAYRRMTGTGGVRSVQAVLIPPGPMHVHAVHTVGGLDPDLLVAAAGLWSSLPIDFAFKVFGKPDLTDDVARRLPIPGISMWSPSLHLRTLRLNCLTADYAPLWNRLVNPSWTEDSWTSTDERLGVLRVADRWSMDAPLRSDLQRRQALVELDALGALILGISVDQLCKMYRTQFGVLRKYEHAMRHDANGRQVPSGVLKDYEKYGESAELGRYELPFTRPDREADMRVAYAEFERRAAQA
jgi:hypothetical protein